MPISIDLVLLVPMALLWLLVYHVAYSAVAILRDRSVVAWGIGPLGVNVVALREPGGRLVLAQLVAAGAAAALVIYGSLYALVPAPIGGLARTLPGEVATVLAPTVLLTLGSLLGILREHRYPIWGEARLMLLVQRGLLSGSRIFFTPRGQKFVRDHFGATTGEFLRMLRAS